MMTKEKAPKGQILIILMLALAIISILLVIISRNVRRDTLDQLQSEQYEDYYSAVEQELLKIISNQSSCDLNTTDNCEVELTQLSRAAVLNKNTLYVIKDDIINFTNLVVGKDKSITLPLDGYNQDLKFGWKGEVAWVVNIDYKTNGGEYQTSQSIFDNNSPKIFQFKTPADNCLNFTDFGSNSFGFNIDQCLSSESPGYTALSVRMKPIMLNSSTTELTLLEPTNGLPPQARIIIATADIDDDLANTPSIQLELQIPTKNPSLEILDYALRTNKTVSKPKP